MECGSSSCLTVGGLRGDRAVAAAVLEAIQPAGVHAALAALEQVTAAHDTTQEALTLALEQAHYEAQRARRQYDFVDPANRLVAGALERDWNEALERGKEVAAQLAAPQRPPLTLSEAPRAS